MIKGVYNLGYEETAYVVASPGYRDLPMYVHSAGWSLWKKGNSFGVTDSPSCVISLNVYGSLDYVQDGIDFRLSSPGDVVILRPGSDHHYECVSDFHADRYVTVSGPVVSEFLRNSGLGTAVIVRPQSVSHTNRLLRRIFALADQSQPEALIEASSLAFQLLLHLAISSRGVLPQPVAEALSFIHGHLHDRLTNQDISRSARLSRAQLCSLFRKSLGVSPLAYYRDRKMELAKTMLSSSSRRVKEIAADLGYDDQLIFSRDFRKHVGHSPRSFRAGGAS